jgi:hypothetical protein
MAEVRINLAEVSVTYAWGLTLVVQVHLAAVGLCYAAADALHASLDDVLRLARERTSGSDDLHAVGDDVEAMATLDGTTGNHTALQGILWYVAGKCYAPLRTIR